MSYKQFVLINRSSTSGLVFVDDLPYQKEVFSPLLTGLIQQGRKLLQVSLSNLKTMKEGYMKFCSHCKYNESQPTFDQFEDIFFPTCSRCGKDAIFIGEVDEIDIYEIGSSDLFNIWPDEFERYFENFEMVVFSGGNNQVAFFSESTVNKGFYWTGEIVKEEQSFTGFMVLPIERISIHDLETPDDLLYSTQQLWTESGKVGGFQSSEVDSEMKLVFWGATSPHLTPYTSGALADEVEIIGVKLGLEVSTPLDIKVAFTDVWDNR